MDIAHFKAAMGNIKTVNEEAYQLQIKDAITKEILNEDSAIPEHRKLILIRIPRFDYVRRGPKKSTLFDDQAPTKMVPAPMPTQSELKSLLNPESTDADELMRIKEMARQTAKEFAPFKTRGSGKRNGNDDEMEKKKKHIRRAHGLPKSWLIPCAEDDPRALLCPDGTFARRKDEELPEAPAASSSANSSSSVPPSRTQSRSSNSTESAKLSSDEEKPAAAPLMAPVTAPLMAPIAAPVIAPVTAPLPMPSAARKRFLASDAENRPMKRQSVQQQQRKENQIPVLVRKVPLKMNTSANFQNHSNLTAQPQVSYHPPPQVQAYSQLPPPQVGHWQYQYVPPQYPYQAPSQELYHHSMPVQPHHYANQLVQYGWQ